LIREASVAVNVWVFNVAAAGCTANLSFGPKVEIVRTRVAGVTVRAKKGRYVVRTREAVDGIAILRMVAMGAKAERFNDVAET